MKVKCKYHAKCEEALNCGGAREHEDRHCEPCPRHRDEKVCLPIEEIHRLDEELMKKRAASRAKVQNEN